MRKVKEQQKAREEAALAAVSKAGEPYRAAEMRQSKLARDDVRGGHLRSARLVRTSLGLAEAGR